MHKFKCVRQPLFQFFLLFPLFSINFVEWPSHISFIHVLRLRTVAKTVYKFVLHTVGHHMSNDGWQRHTIDIHEFFINFKIGTIDAGACTMCICVSAAASRWPQLYSVFGTPCDVHRVCRNHSIYNSLNQFIISIEDKHITFAEWMDSYCSSHPLIIWACFRCIRTRRRRRKFSLSSLCIKKRIITMAV